MTFTVTRDGVNNPAGTVDFASADGSAQAGIDYTAVNGTLSFDAGELQKFIQVPILDDAVWEPAESFFVNLSNPSNGAIIDGQGEGTIDDGPPGPPPPSGTPEIEVLDQFAAIVEDDIGWINVAFTHVGSPVEYTFTITNIGDGTLELDPQSLSLPEGFSLIGSFPATIARSDSAPFVVELDATAPGFFSGEVVFLNNDLDENPFNFALEGEVWNLRPVALDDVYSTLQDTPLTVSAPGVLANDVDPDAHPLTATLVQGPAHGTQFSLNSDGSFSYEPESGWTGVDSFTYTVNDGFESSEDAATVTIGVLSSFGPEIEVRYDNGISVPDGTGLVDFGETSLGEGVLARGSTGIFLPDFV
ncbi:MAG: cadherin-like domain-containing protein [Planctomycetia bacterium]|nr:cadherin-like domain-containing protein [Planctomycetia bacterium]